MNKLKISELSKEIQEFIESPYGKEEGIELIKNGDWIDDGKYSHCTTIFKINDKFYAYYNSRSGSYFSDYDYNPEEDLYEVEKVEVIKHEWKEVKNG